MHVYLHSFAHTHVRIHAVPFAVKSTGLGVGGLMLIIVYTRTHTHVHIHAVPFAVKSTGLGVGGLMLIIVALATSFSIHLIVHTRVTSGMCAYVCMRVCTYV